jgi:purine-nucleoside phosphorylase
VIYQDLINGMMRYGSTMEDICMHAIGVGNDKIRENVILAPWWEPAVMPSLGEAEYISASDFASIKAWNIKTGKQNITYIKTGIGAPVLMDVVLALGVTSCRKIIFIGSVGALDSNIDIGDIVLPEYSVCGDGASRYIVNDLLKSGDIFGQKAYPDMEAFASIQQITDDVCRTNNVKWHIGRNFSIDTIFAQFYHLDEIMEMGCNVIEMETAAAFRAAQIADIKMSALFSVSDNTIKNKSLISGRTQEEIEYRKYVRREIFPQIILKFFNR